MEYLIITIIISVVVFAVLKKKKKTSKSNIEQVNTSYGMSSSTKNIVAEPASIPIAQVPEVESNLGSETAVITPETVIPKKKRAPRKKKEA